MTSTFDLQKVNLPEMVNSVTTIICSPLIIPVAEVVKQPVVKTTISEGMLLSQRLQAVVTAAMEEWENQSAVNSHLRQDFQPRTTHDTNGRPSMAEDFIHVMSDFNTDVDQITDGVMDLRSLFPLALALLALGQLVKQGTQWDTIPWYLLAWFAFDSFVKLHEQK
jgi:hypothetical protein